MVRSDLTHVAFAASFGFVAAAAALAPILERRWTPHVFGGIVLALGLGAWLNYRQKEHDIRIYTEPSTFRDEAFGNPVTHVFLDAPEGSKIAADGLYCFFTRDSAISFTYIAEFDGYFSDAQWRQLADEIVQREPAMVRLTDGQFIQIMRWRPEFAQMYREDTEAWVLKGPDED
jgi:hypothetical protein